MGLKRRLAKRRFDLQHLIDVWSMPLVTGWYYFRELNTIGVEVDRMGRPNLEVAREAWRNFGATLLAQRGPTECATWAERTFGQPWEVEENNAS